MTYKEVFQLAQDKGCNTHFLCMSVIHELNTYKAFGEPELTIEELVVTLSLIQKWLRDEHKMEVLPQNCIEYPLDKELRRKGYGGMVYFIDKDKNVGSFFGYTYEESLLEGINEALKLIP